MWPLRCPAEAVGDGRRQQGEQAWEGHWGRTRSIPSMSGCRRRLCAAQVGTPKRGPDTSRDSVARRWGGEEVAIGGGDLGPSGFQRSRP